MVGSWFTQEHRRERERASGEVEMKTSFKVGVRCFPLMRKGVLKQGRCIQNH